MCVAMPSKVISIKEKQAQIKQDDHVHWVDISLIKEKVKVGDYLISYQSAAINKISKQEAKEILDLVNSTSNTGVK